MFLRFPYRTVLFISFLVFIFFERVHAQTVWTNSGSGQWNDGANWSAGVPDITDVTDIVNSGTAVVDNITLSASARQLDVGNATAPGGDGNVIVTTGGTLTTAQTINLGTSTLKGTLTVSGGVVSTGDVIRLGFLGGVGTGSMTLNSGTILVGGPFPVEFHTNTSGFIMNGGLLQMVGLGGPGVSAGYLQSHFINSS